MEYYQVFKRCLLSSLICSPITLLIIIFCFNGFEKNSIASISVIIISIITFNIACIISYPVAMFEKKNINHYKCGTLTCAVHSIVYYPSSMLMLKIVNNNFGKFTHIDNTFWLFLLFSSSSAFVFFIWSLIRELIDNRSLQ